MTIERIRLFHSNDIHSCFDHWAQIVSHIKRNRDPNTLYVDLGDHTDRSNPMTEATLGKGNTRLLNEAQVDFVTIGNNEGITFAKEDLEALYEDATFPVLLANLVHQDGRQPSWVRRTMIHTMESGVKIGMLGLTAPFTYFYEQLGWTILPPKEVLAEILPELKKEADIVILLSHLGLFRDEEIAKEYEGIDVIIGAHSHDVLHEGKRLIGTLITQTGKYGAYLGEIKLDYDTDTKQVVSSSATLIDVKRDEKDADSIKLLEAMTIETKHSLSERVANIPRKLDVHWQEETEAVQLLCDAISEWCDEEISMMNAGVLLESIEQGWLTKGDVHRICPHPINLCVVKLTGKQLMQTIKRAYTTEMRTLELKGFGFRGKVLGRMIFTGIDIQFDVKNEVEHVNILGERLEMEKEYTLATLDMYTFGHLYPAVTESIEKKYVLPDFLRDVLAWKLKKLWA